MGASDERDKHHGRYAGCASALYPKRRAGFFITGGIGLGGITVDGDTEFGVGLMIGIGWDLDVSPHVSLTPFYGGVGIANSTADAYFGQLGIGVTVH